MIFKNITEIKRIYIGSNEIKKVYLGGDVCFEKQEPVYPVLPEGYTPIEYIESSGTQFISTGITGYGTWTFTIQAAAGTGSQLFLNKGSGSGNWFGAISSNKWGSGTTSGQYTSISSTTKATCVINYTASSIDGTVNEETFTRSHSANANNFYLFSAPDGTYSISAKLWNIKFEREGNLLFEGVPCRNSSDIVGLYDLVSNTFISSTGSGQFVGSDG